MMILLARMRIFSPFVEKHFSFTPKTVSLSIFVLCLLIHCPYVFEFKTVSFGDYLSMNDVDRHGTFYRFVSSDFYQTSFSKIFLAFTQFFLIQLPTLAVGLALNVISVIQHKSYLRKKLQIFRMAPNAPNHNNNNSNVASNHITNLEVPIVPIGQELTPKERNDRNTEQSMFYMALTLCTIDLASRFILMIIFVFFQFFYTFEFSLILETIFYSVHSLMPFKIFVFYSFNKIFRQVCRQKIFQRDSTKHAS
jgi:hypothetical protein